MTSPMCASPRSTAISARQRILKRLSPSLRARMSRRKSARGESSGSGRVFAVIVAILHELVDVLALRARLLKSSEDLLRNAVVGVSRATHVSDVEFTLCLVIVNT